MWLYVSYMELKKRNDYVNLIKHRCDVIPLF